MTVAARRHDAGSNPVIVACATALPAHTAVVRLSGTQAIAVARAAGLPIADQPRQLMVGTLPLLGGTCPVRTWYFLGPHSFTGEDTIELAIPGSRAVVAAVESALHAAGALSAEPGAFARRALANGRLTLDRAEAILAVANAGDAAAAQAAIGRLRGRLADDIEPLRDRVIYARALVEAGLDFAGEDGIESFDPVRLLRDISDMRSILARWHVAAATVDSDPVIALVGPANAGKSALFHALTGHDVLVSPVAGTTRDVLEAICDLDGRQVRVIDTAGWLDAAADVDARAIAAGRSAVHNAAVVVACSAPDARLPESIPEADQRWLIIATKADLGVHEARAVVAVSASDGTGLPALRGCLAQRLGAIGGGEPRQAAAIERCIADMDALVRRLPEDALLAEDLRRLADHLGDIIGLTTADDVLNTIFGRFCIGK